VIDLCNTAFVDSTALGIFVRAFKRLRSRGVELVLRSPRTNVRKVLHISGLDTVINIEP
jgi:anti-anti-sigma factor